MFKFVSTNSNSFFVGIIFKIQVSDPTLSNPSPLWQVTKNPASPSESLKTSLKYCISDLNGDWGSNCQKSRARSGITQKHLGGRPFWGKLP